MGLVDFADRKEFDDTLVRAFHCLGVFFVIGALVLVDENTGLIQRLVAVAIEFFGEEAFAGAERVSGIDNNQIVFIFTGADETQAVLEVQGDTGVIEFAGELRQILAADIYDTLIDFDHVNMPDTGIPC